MTRVVEGNGGASPRALNIPEFCQRYGVCRSKTYQEIRAKRLKARKAGARTVIAVDDAEQWLRALPAFGNKRGSKGAVS
jgi:predicted DNA-binding transcriptional regulator AlpA